MKVKIIKKEDFLTTKWAGGETTQLAIYPEDAIFSNKDFLWRISSASFTSTESSFSDFTGYQRYILALEGKLNLYHKGLYHRKLDKYDVEYFDGSWTTFSENTLDCIDYNFIVKSGSLAKLQILKEGDGYDFKASTIATFFSSGDFTIDIPGLGERILKGFSLLVLEFEREQGITITKGKDPIIVTEFKGR